MRFDLIPAVAVVATASVALAACVPPGEDQAVLIEQADAVYADLVAGRDDAVIAQMSSKADVAQVRAQLDLLRPLVPSGPIPAGRTGGWGTNAGTGGTTRTVTRIYAYPDRTVTTQTAMREENGGWKVDGFSLNATANGAATPPRAEAADEASAKATI